MSRMKQAIEDFRGLPLSLVFFGKPMRMERLEFDKMLDVWTLAEALGLGEDHITELLRMAKNCKRLGKIVVSEGWVAEQRSLARKLLDDEHSREDALASSAYAGVVGPKAAPTADPAKKPMAFIAAAVAFKLGVPYGEMVNGMSRGRKPIADARLICYALMRDLAKGKTLVQIARMFDRDHTSVISGIDRVNRTPNLSKLKAEIAETIGKFFPR